MLPEPEAVPGDTAVLVENLAKSFPGAAKPALQSVCAAIPRGAVTGLAGPDGAGKTTLIRLLVGLLRADSGRVSVNIGESALDTVKDAGKIHEFCAYMPQKFGLYDDLSVMENLRLYADLRSLAPAGRQERFERLLAFTGLADFQARLAGRLSGGMKQKLGLACSLLGSPKVLLLDEPSVGVDPVSRRELWEMVQSLLAEDLAVLWSTSYLDEAEKCASVILLNEGRLLFHGPPERLLERVRGRCFLIDAAPRLRRPLLTCLLAEGAVTDAVIQGRALRVVLPKQKTEPGAQSPGAPERILDSALELAKGLYPDLFPPGSGRAAPPEWRETPPRFEDAFIDILGGGPKGRSALGESMPGKPFSEAPVIDARSLTKRFGDFTAVKDNSFRIGRGEIFGLLGPNGAGKSTTFKMLCGLLQPSSGTASIMGLDLGRSSSAARSRIGYMAQKFSLYGSLSVGQNLEFFSGVYGLSGKKRRAAVELMISLFGLAPHLAANAEALPLGFKQRLALACSVMHQPDVLFLDEPTSGVDPVTRREFWMHINAVVAKGVTVMVTTHFMDEAEYCDRIALIHRGENIASGTPDELKSMAAGGDDLSLEDAFIILVKRREART